MCTRAAKLTQIRLRSSASNSHIAQDGRSSATQTECCLSPTHTFPRKSWIQELVSSASSDSLWHSDGVLCCWRRSNTTWSSLTFLTSGCCRFCSSAFEMRLASEQIERLSWIEGSGRSDLQKIVFKVASSSLQASVVVLVSRGTHVGADNGGSLALRSVAVAGRGSCGWGWVTRTHFGWRVVVGSNKNLQGLTASSFRRC